MLYVFECLHTLLRVGVLQYSSEQASMYTSVKTKTEKGRTEEQNQIRSDRISKRVYICISRVHKWLLCRV